MDEPLDGLNTREIIAATTGGGTATAEDEVRAMLRALVEASNAGDELRAFYATAAPGRVIGTDDDDWLTIPEMLALLAAADTDGVVIVPGDVEVGVITPDVAWAADHFRMRGPGGTDRNARFSAVLVREADGWKILQSHVSVGVPNDRLFDA